MVEGNLLNLLKLFAATLIDSHLMIIKFVHCTTLQFIVS